MTLVGGAVLLPRSAASQTPHPSSMTQAPSSATVSTSSARPKHHKKPEAVPAAVPQPAVAPNLLEQPATPATVTAHTNELTVKADNSSLSQILHQVSSATGMKLDGLGGDERVFGSFGPGAPREVLTALLNGTSYNVILIGELPNGAPRELLLSTRGAGGAPPSQPANPIANQNQAQPTDQDNPDDTASPDDSDDSSPPMVYTPPSIAPAEPPPSNGPAEAPPRPMPQTQSEPQ